MHESLFDLLRDDYDQVCVWRVRNRFVASFVAATEGICKSAVGETVDQALTALEKQCVK